MSGYGIQVIEEYGDTFRLNEEELKTLLYNKDIGKCSGVMVLSIMGALRKGKSFLLNFFLRYLNNKYNLKESEDKWLAAEEEQGLTGFDWRGGSDAHTKGLWLWSKPFIATLENKKKVAILLMDTQGTFDSESTIKENALILGLSMLISSVQIYNLSGNIQEDDLLNLQMFSNYSNAAQKEKKETSQPFQHLLFLVRDWSWPYEYKYGAEGGEQLLKKTAMIRKGQHKELQVVRRDISKYFEETTCFLMPHPGFNVTTEEKFKGNISDIDDKFKVYLKQLAPLLLAPENLKPKRFGDRRVKAKELMDYFKNCFEALNSEEQPELKTMLETAGEVNNLAAMNEGRYTYNKLMKDVLDAYKPYLRQKRLRQTHLQAKDEALNVFKNIKKLGSVELENKHGQQLAKELEEQFEHYRKANEVKYNPWLMIPPLWMWIILMVFFILLVLLGILFSEKQLVAIGIMIFILILLWLGRWIYIRMIGNWCCGIGIQTNRTAERNP